MNNKLHHALDTELQRQRYGENSDLLKALGYNTDVMNIRRMANDIATGDTWRYMESKDLEDLDDLKTDFLLYEWVVN